MSTGEIMTHVYIKSFIMYKWKRGKTASIFGGRDWDRSSFINMWNPNKCYSIETL